MRTKETGVGRREGVAGYQQDLQKVHNSKFLPQGDVHPLFQLLGELAKGLVSVCPDLGH